MRQMLRLMVSVTLLAHLSGCIITSTSPNTIGPIVMNPGEEMVFSVESSQLPLRSICISDLCTVYTWCVDGVGAYPEAHTVLAPQYASESTFSYTPQIADAGMHKITCWVIDGEPHPAIDGGIILWQGKHEWNVMVKGE